METPKGTCVLCGKKFDLSKAQQKKFQDAKDFGRPLPDFTCGAACQKRWFQYKGQMQRRREW